MMLLCRLCGSKRRMSQLNRLAEQDRVDSPPELLDGINVDDLVEILSPAVLSTWCLAHAFC